MDDGEADASVVVLVVVLEAVEGTGEETVALFLLGEAEGEFEGVVLIVDVADCELDGDGEGVGNNCP